MEKKMICPSAGAGYACEICPHATPHERVPGCAGSVCLAMKGRGDQAGMCIPAKVKRRKLKYI
jgi:hypothetical protein